MNPGPGPVRAWLSANHPASDLTLGDLGRRGDDSAGGAVPALAGRALRQLAPAGA